MPKTRTETQVAKADAKTKRAAAKAEVAQRDEAASAGFVLLTHDQIEADPENDRRIFDEKEIEGLAESIFATGLQQPIKVGLKGENGKRRLVMGERRWRAWGLLIERGHWQPSRELACSVSTGDEAERREQALVENACRVDLTHLEYADAFERLATSFGRTNRQIATVVGRTIEFVQQHRGLTELDKKQRAALAAGNMTFHDARRIVSDKRKAEKAAAALTPAVRLVFVEIACKIKADSPADQYCWWKGVEIDPAAEDPALAELVASGALRRGPDYRTQRETVDLQSYRFGEGLRELLERLKDDDQRPAIQAATRIEALGEEAAAAIEPDKFACAFLNGPWELPADRQAVLDERAAAERAAEERLASEKQRAAEAAKAFKKLSGEVRTTAKAQQPLFPNLQASFEGAGVALPLVFKAGVIQDASGRQLNGYGNGVADKELAMKTLVLAANAALGFAKSAAENVAKADDDDDEAEEMATADDDGTVDLEEAIAAGAAKADPAEGFDPNGDGVVHLAKEPAIAAAAAPAPTSRRPLKGFVAELIAKSEGEAGE